MKTKELDIVGVYLIETRIFGDERGTFLESFNQADFEEKTSLKINFVQDNHSISKSNVFRGLHFQTPPFAQAKLIRVTKGSVIDVFLDIRKESKTFGEIRTIKLQEGDGLSLFIPEGIAHGFLALEDDTHFHYKCSNYYHPASEETINIKGLWEESEVKGDLILNDKDANGTLFQNFNTPF